MEISFWNLLYHRVEIGICLSLIKVIPLFTLTRKRNNKTTFLSYSKYCTAFNIRCLIGRNQNAVKKYKAHTNFTCGELSDLLCEG